jgi:hypothetical protein
VSYPWWEVPVHPFVLLAANLPWSLCVLPTFAPSFYRLWDARGRRLVQALHCWVWPNLAFWSLVSEHAPRYSFPLFPGIAGLAALVWVAWLDGRLRWPVPRPGPRPVLVGLLATWLVAKVVFAAVVPYQRNANRQPRARGHLLASLVPADETLFVFEQRNKNEGILFHYGRRVLRLPGPDDLPATGAHYCLLEPQEYQRWSHARAAELVSLLPDEHGSWAALVRVAEVRRVRDTSTRGY